MYQRTTQSLLVDTNQVDVQSTVNSDADADLEIGQVIKAGGGHNSNVPPQYKIQGE